MNGRERFKGFLNGEPVTRPAFVPLIRGLLARVEGMSMETLTSDPTLWVNGLMKTTQLFGLDGVVVGLDVTLMAEASGCPVTWEEDRPILMPLQGDLNEAPELTVGPDEGFLRVEAEVYGVWTSRIGGLALELRPYLRVLNALNRRDALFYHFDPYRNEGPVPLADLPVIPLLGFEVLF